MAQPQWLDERESKLWRAYLEMRSYLDLAIERQLAESGLSSADYRLLVPLSEAAAEGVRARDLGRDVSWDRSRLSHQLRRMEQRGLIQRRNCPTDGRGTMVTLTEAGRKAVELAAPGHVEIVRRHFVDLLSTAEIDVLTTIATRVRNNIADAVPAPDCCS